MGNLTVDFIKHQLKQVIDPEVSINIVDLGLIYDVVVNSDESIEVKMTMTTPGCPMQGFITEETQKVLNSLTKSPHNIVDVVWSPAWTPELINPMALKAQQMKESKIVTLDVRPLLAAGGEPFQIIMEAIAKTSDDGALRLIAPFRPAPLFDVLRKKGWDYWIELEKDGNWYIWFFKKEHERLTKQDFIWTLDVRQMAPPEPMELTLEILDKMPKGVTLIQINERAPQFLFEALEQRGFAYEVEGSMGDSSEVRTKIIFNKS